MPPAKPRGWERYLRRRMAMLSKTVIVLLAVASVGLASPTMVLARGGGGGGGGFRGGGFAGGVHGGGFDGGSFHGGMAGGFRDGGFHGRGFAGGFHDGRGFHDRGGFHDRDCRGFHDRDFGHRFGFGFYPYGNYDDYAYDYPYAYGDSYYDNGSCYVVQRRVHTTRGWRRQPVQVCG